METNFILPLEQASPKTLSWFGMLPDCEPIDDQGHYMSSDHIIKLYPDHVLSWDIQDDSYTS